MAGKVPRQNPTPDVSSVAVDDRSEEVAEWFAEAMEPAAVVKRLRWLRNGDARLHSIELKRVKPNRRCLIRYEVGPHDHHGPARQLLGKIRKKGLDLVTAEVHHRLYERLKKSPGPLAVAEPAGVITDWQMSLQWCLDGQNAEELLVPDNTTRVAGKIGLALAQLHTLNMPVPRRHTNADELKILENGLERVMASTPVYATRIRHLQDACHALINELKAPEVTGIHRDFYPAQVICHGEQVGFVDLDLFAVGDPAIDVGNFLAHLKEAALRRFQSAQALQHHETLFLESYLQANPRVTLQAVQVHTLVSFTRQISICQRMPDRRPYLAAIISHCEFLLANCTTPVSSLSVCSY